MLLAESTCLHLCYIVLWLLGCVVTDSESVVVSSSGTASDAEQVESVARQPSASASVGEATSIDVDEPSATPESSDVTAVDSELQPSDQATAAHDKSEPDGKPANKHHETTVDKRESTTDTWLADDASKPSVVVFSSAELSHEGKKSGPDSDTSHSVTVAKEALGDVEPAVKTRGKSRVGSRSVSSNVDAVTDLEGSGVDSATESGKMKPGVEDKTKTARVKKKCTEDDSSDKVEKKTKKPTSEDKAADDEHSNEGEEKMAAKVKEEEISQKSRVSDLKAKDDKQELELSDQKGRGKDTGDTKSQKPAGTRKGGLSTTSDFTGREKRSRVQAEKTDSYEMTERTVGRGRRKARVGQSDVVLSETDNSQEPEQYSVCESSDSASAKLDSKTAKQETVESSSFEGLSAADDFSRKISDDSVADLSAKEQCYKADVCENSSETTNSGAAAGVEHMLHADVASILTAAFTDSPAYTSADELGPAGGSYSSSAGGASSLSPAADADEEHTSTKSELEANMEVAAYMGGGGSTNEGELSSDEDDDDSSSVNTLSRKPSHKSDSCTVKRKSDDGSFQHSVKRRRREKQHHRTRSHHASSAVKSCSYRNDGNLYLHRCHIFLCNNNNFTVKICRHTGWDRKTDCFLKFVTPVQVDIE